MKEGLGPAEGCAAAVCAAYTQGVDPGAGHACVGSRLILVPGSGGHAGSGHGHGGLVGGPVLGAAPCLHGPHPPSWPAGDGAAAAPACA